MKEYFIEGEKEVDLKKLESKRVPPDEYSSIHSKEIRACHDVFIKYRGGILLVKRKDYPAKDILWPIGGGMRRGLKVKDSLRIKVKEECNLDIKNIKEIGYARTAFSTDPFGHGKGTDSLNIIFSAEGYGNLKLNEYHANPTIVTSKEYNEEFRNSLHPYVKDFMDIVMEIIN